MYEVPTEVIVCKAEWYVLGSRYSTHCSKSNVGIIKYSCMLNSGLCNLVDYFVNKP